MSTDKRKNMYTVMQTWNRKKQKNMWDDYASPPLSPQMKRTKDKQVYQHVIWSAASQTQTTSSFKWTTLLMENPQNKFFPVLQWENKIENNLKTMWDSPVLLQWENQSRRSKHQDVFLYYTAGTIMALFPPPQRFCTQSSEEKSKLIQTTIKKYSDTKPKKCNGTPPP